MNLLEYFKKHLNDATTKLAFQLLSAPWNTDLQELGRHVPITLHDRFASLQKDVLIRLGRIEGKSLPICWIGVDSVIVRQHNPGTDDEALLTSGNDLHWIDQIWSQIIEDLEKEGVASSLLDEADRDAFIVLYTIAHACFFILVKVFDLSGQSKRGFSLVHNSEAVHAQRLYWFAHHMSWQSLISDHLLIRNILESVSNDSLPMHVAFHASSDRLALCRDIFTDKFLSLHPDYLHLMHKKDQGAMNAMTDRLGLIIYIYLCSVEQLMDAGKEHRLLRFDGLLAVEFDAENFRLAGFSNQAIKELIDECMRQPAGDRFLVDLGEGRLQMGDISLKYAMQKYCHALQDSMYFRGEWFEQAYIANYVRERIPANRYRVFEGVKDKHEKYDADVIIEDMRTGALYFCQVKHRTSPLLAHLRDELGEYMNEKGQISHGLTQIKNLRSRIGSDEVLMRVKQRTGHRKLTAESLGDRARYLMIHNIENLDFCTSEGIAMYEWNTLRNLMKGTMDTTSKDGITSTHIFAGDINLDKPHQVMEALCEWMDINMPKDQAPALHWRCTRESRLVFEARNLLYFKRFRPLHTYSSFAFSMPVI